MVRGNKKLVIEMTETELVEELHGTDYLMSRLAEDLVGLMVKKGVLRIEELPFQSMEKFKYRSRLRIRLNELRAQKYIDTQRRGIKNDESLDIYPDA